MQRTALVLGGNGFIGAFVVAALRAHGWRVRRLVRQRGAMHGQDECHGDLAGMTDPAAWREALAGVHAVVNVAGILRERGRDTFAAIHVDAPLALAQACVATGVSRYVQVSALGDPADAAFIASKHRFDDALLALPLHAVVLRPSLVYSAAGSFGGSSLMRAMAALPWALPLPGNGRWPLDPIAAEDIGELVAQALVGDARGMYEVGGPQRMSLRDYQWHWRRWFGHRGHREWHIPERVVGLQARLGQWLGAGPVGQTTWRLLQRGCVTGDGALARLRDDFGVVPRTLHEALAQRPAQVQDRWHAHLYVLGPLLRGGVVALWLLSALVGWITPPETIEQMVEGSALAGFAPVVMARATASLDLVLALWLCTSWRPRWAVTLMLLSVLGYTLGFGLGLSAQWLDPLGGLAKNLALLPALAVLWVLVERRG
ncbi:SDR family oxidoreductase [Lysobacter psychrotolerans]|uniref:SDR family oxidoreductase n=2 Tax=Montanilutibacter psychrotolerans TaxID=1327343 RepID=A0A3M8STP0_9GAMM|nr:SDR family oxidoreductase [Lysobacter psychrotolerans]